MLKTEKLYSLSDVTIIPSDLSEISSRSECNPYVESLTGEEEYLPLITAPMSSVVDAQNWVTFKESKISSIIPRTVPINIRLLLCQNVFCAFSLQEAFKYFVSTEHLPLPADRYYVLIDIANGHMKDQVELGKKIKKNYAASVLLMGGNIANPETYIYYDEAGFDYLRCGIAGGSQCLTGTQTGIHYPMASLIDKINTARLDSVGKTKIIADGGINSYSDAIKCLALGADYVMLGKIFAQAEEACEPVYEVSGKKYRHYYGMSTKEAQTKMEKKDLKTSEGKSSEVPVLYTLSSWTDNFTSYLRSAMSYTGSLDLPEFRELSICQLISGNSSVRINEK